MKKILVVGSLNMDLVTHVHKTPKVGETVLGNGLKEIPGGKGANQAVAIGRLGGDVCMLGRVGDDGFGETLLNNLQKNQVDATFVEKVKDMPSGTALIMVNHDGDNSIVVVPGANFELKKDMITEAVFKDVDYVLAQLETPMETIEEVFVKAKAQGITTVLNPAPARDLSPRLLDHVDMLVPNETEFELITGFSGETQEGLNEGTAKLFEMGLSEVLITLGKKGACYMNKDGKVFRTSGYKVNAVDTTAAGDSFIGGLLTRLAMGESVEDSMEYAMKVGAVTVSRHGAQSSLPSVADIDEFEGVKNP